MRYKARTNFKTRVMEERIRVGDDERALTKIRRGASWMVCVGAMASEKFELWVFMPAERALVETGSSVVEEMR